MFKDGVANIEMNDIIIAVASKSAKMFLIIFLIEETCAKVAKIDNTTLWHKILGHIGNNSLKRLRDLSNNTHSRVKRLLQLILTLLY